MRYVEILTNLGELPVRGAYFIFMPVKIADSSGGPGRAMALRAGVMTGGDPEAVSGTAFVRGGALGLLLVW